MPNECTDFTIVNARVITPDEIIERGSVAISGGRFAAVGTGLNPAGAAMDVRGRTVCPGLIDLQVNGHGGHDCMSGRAGDIAALCHLLPGTGCTGFLPTTVTATRPRLTAALAAAAEARRMAPPGARILGIHVEGPYISTAIDARGAHDVTHIRPFDPEEWTALAAAAKGGIRVLTLAPESDDNLRYVKSLADSGIVVAVGHTSATYEQIAAAARAGATMATHAFNGMRGLHHREPGAVGAVLDLDEIACTFVADGFHTHPAALRLLLRAKGLDRAVAVTDASWVAGLPAGDYVWEGGPIHFDGLAPRTPDGRLAGSALTMIGAVRNLVGIVGLSLRNAIRTATVNPARVLGLGNEVGSIAVGKRADLVVLEPDLRISATFVGGELVYRSPDF